MARPRQFDRDQALLQAIKVFCDKGFAAASTEELMNAMGLSRQSMYNAFGDKRQLYLHAMQQYQANSVSDLIWRLSKDATPLESLRNTLLSFASRAEREGTAGCMGVNAVCEFGLSDDEVNQLTDSSARTLRSALERTLRDAVEQQQIAAHTDIPGACIFLLSTLSGMKVSAKAGASVEQLQAIAGFAIQGLTPVEWVD
ncbi:TetR/AcrR family transcriptional regulator [Pseudomonas sp. NA-150]|uniref:TetR/AcrR family transcriptional regulator n=1 Tax=Pseudomonas sp. NA-150 TaxID=3367525 RepID=UPI0037C9C767